MYSQCESASAFVIIRHYDTICSPAIFAFNMLLLLPYLCTLHALATYALNWSGVDSVQPVVSGACSEQSDQSCRPDTCSTAALQHPAPTSPAQHRGKRKLDLGPPLLTLPCFTSSYTQLHTMLVLVLDNSLAPTHGQFLKEQRWQLLWMMVYVVKMLRWHRQKGIPQSDPI